MVLATDEKRLAVIKDIAADKTKVSGLVEVLTTHLIRKKENVNFNKKALSILLAGLEPLSFREILQNGLRGGFANPLQALLRIPYLIELPSPSQEQIFTFLIRKTAVDDEDASFVKTRLISNSFDKDFDKARLWKIPGVRSAFELLAESSLTRDQQAQLDDKEKNIATSDIC